MATTAPPRHADLRPVLWRRPRRPLGVLLAAAFGAVGCNAIWGLDTLEYEGAGGAGTGSGTTSTGTPTGGGGGTPTGTPTGPCEPPETRPCYSGPEQTQDVGECHGGTATCLANGTWGPCEDETTPVPDSCATTADLDCDGSACRMLWQRSFGGTSEDYVQGVAVDDQGSTIITGSFQGTTSFGGQPLTSAGGRDWFVAKLDPDGNHVWSHRFGGAGDQGGAGIAMANDGADGNFVVAGYTNASFDFGKETLPAAGQNDVVIAKLDAAGIPIWSAIHGSSAIENTRRVAVGPAGVIAVTGNYYGNFDLGGGNIGHAGGSDVFLGVYDADGTHVWSDSYGNNSDQYVRYVAFGPNGTITLTGQFEGQISFGGGDMQSNGGRDSYLAQLSLTGAHSWSHSFGSAGDQQLTSLAFSSANSLITAGRFAGELDLGGGALTSAGGEDIVLARFSAAGTHLASEAYGDGAEQRADDVAVSPTNRAMVVGNFQGSLGFMEPALLSAGADDVYMAAFSPDGDALFARSFPVTGSPDPNVPAYIPRCFVAAAESDAFVIAGFYGGTITVDGQELPSSGGADIYVIKVR